MLRIDKDNTISIPRGDSGVFLIELDTTMEFTEEDKSIFAIKRSKSKEPAIYKIIPIIKVNDVYTITVRLSNEDTRNLLGDYEWDIRIVKDALINDEGRVIAGDVISDVHSLFALDSLPIFQIVEVSADV